MSNSITPGADLAKRQLRVFLCHTTGDIARVRDLYRRLGIDGFDVWLDEERLLPGQDWQREIAKAVSTSDALIVCLSHLAVSKAGYMQKEIQFALDVADEHPEGTIFLIPLKLEECEVPERLSRWRWVSLFEKLGYEKLIRALRSRAHSLGLINSQIKSPHRMMRRLRSLRASEIGGILIATIALVIALLNWLLPLNSIGSSPFAPRAGTLTETATLSNPILLVSTPTANTTSTPPILPTIETLTEPSATATNVAVSSVTDVGNLSPTLTHTPIAASQPSPVSTLTPTLLPSRTPLKNSPLPTGREITDDIGLEYSSLTYGFDRQTITDRTLIHEGTLVYFTVLNRGNRDLCIAGHAGLGIRVPWPNAPSFFEGRLVGAEGQNPYCLKPSESIEIEVLTGIHWLGGTCSCEIFPSIFAYWQGEQKAIWMPSRALYSVELQF